MRLALWISLACYFVGTLLSFASGIAIGQRISDVEIAIQARACLMSGQELVVLRDKDGKPTKAMCGRRT